MIFDRNINQFKSAFFKKICTIIPFTPFINTIEKKEDSEFWENIKEKVFNQYSKNLTPFELLEDDTTLNSEDEKGIIFNIKKKNVVKSKKELMFEKQDLFFAEK